MGLWGFVSAAGIQLPLGGLVLEFYIDIFSEESLLSLQYQSECFGGVLASFCISLFVYKTKQTKAETACNWLYFTIASGAKKGQQGEISHKNHL